MGTSETMGTSGTETSSAGDEDIVRGDGNVVPGDVVLFPSAARVSVTARDGAVVLGCGVRSGFPDGQRRGSARGARNGRRRVTAAPRGRSARVSREAIGAYPRTHSSAVRLDGPRAPRRDAGTRPARGVVDTETGGDRRGLTSGTRRARAKRDVLSRSARSCASTVARSERGRRACAGGGEPGRGVGAGLSADGSRRGERFSAASARAKNVGVAETPRRARARTQSVGGRARGHSRRDAWKRSRSESTNALATPRTSRRRPRSGDVRRGSRTDGRTDSSRSYCWYRRNFLLRYQRTLISARARCPPSDGISGGGRAAARAGPKQRARRRGRPARSAATPFEMIARQLARGGRAAAAEAMRPDRGP